MLKRQKILIVDDTIANIQILGETLGAEYEVLIATNGNDALDLAQEQLPDIILLDIMMPGMDGYTVCRKLKSDPQTRSIPVIFITAMNEEKNEEKGLDIGAIDYIIKPFSPPIVKARVRNHLELKKYRDHLEQISMMDGLTGISNRRRFDEYLEQEWRRGSRSCNQISLVLMDIDLFKSFNDNYGHIEGDRCLKMVATALSESLQRPADIVARYGGEEFVAVLPDTDSEGALLITKRFMESVRNLGIKHEYSSVAEYVTISCGVVTVIPCKGQTKDAHIKMADELLYEAKQAGRNQIKWIDAI
ncbi:MAG: diguanylate cyclase [Desulfamplus sp.]|nr:diguanylate cyclase [Desulfamplus sp.]